MSYIRYGSPSHDPAGLGNVSRVVSALSVASGPQTHQGSVTLDLTLTVDTTGALRQRARVVRGRDAHSPTQTLRESRLIKGRKVAAGVVDLGLTLNIVTAGFAVKRGAVDVPLTLTIDTNGTTSGRAPRVYRAPEAHHPEQVELTSRTAEPRARLTGAVDLGLTLAIDSAGSILSRPQLFHRALEPHSYPFPESVSRSYQALTASNVVTGSVDLGLTLDISTSGARLGGVRLGIARPGGTNQGFTTRAVDNPGPETVLLESRGFVYYHAAPPIYRSIRPGQTNQGFTFKAPDPEAHPPVERPRLVKGASSSSTKFGAVDLGLSLNIATEGTAKGAGRVRRGLEPHSTPELPNQSRTYFRLPRRWTSSVDLPLTLDISVSGQGRVIGRHLKAPPPQEFPEKPNISRTYFRLPQRHSGTVDLGLSINVSTSGTTQGIGRHLKAPPPQEFPQTPNLSRSYFRLPKRHPGAAGLQLTFGVVTAGTRKTTGSVTFPIVFNIGTEGSILGAGVVGHFDRPTPGGRSRATPGAGQFDRPTPGRQPV